VNWSKTLQRNESIFVSHSLGSHTVTSAAYPKPVAVASFEHDGQISRLFALVLSVLATHLSPILRISHPLSLGLSLDPAMTELNRIIRQAKVYSRLLRAKAESESGPRKQVLTVLFTLLKDDAAVLKALVSRKAFVFGTQDFEYVWEEACLAAVGAERNSKALAQPKMQSLTAIDVSISSQRADGILVSYDPARPSLIVDAKYYIPRDDKVRFSSADLMKQFGYALSARSTFERKNIANALMLPGVEHNGGQCHLLGKVRLEMGGEVLSDVDDVHVLQVSHKAVFDAYMDGAADPRLLADVFENVGWPLIVAAGAGASDDLAHDEYEQFDDNGDYLYPNSFLNDPELVAKVHRHPIGRLTNEEWNSTFVIGYDEDLLPTIRHRFKFMASFLDEEIATGKQVYLMATLKEEGLMGVVSWDYIRQHHKSIKTSEDGIHRELFLEMTETEWLVYASAKTRVPMTRLYPAVLLPVSQEVDADQSLAA
jgi:hypothetical protein